MSRIANLLLFVCVCSPLLLAAQVPAGGEFQVNSYTMADQYGPSASVDAAGNVTVVWMGLQNGPNVLGQRFDAAGQRSGGEFQVNSYTITHNRNPSVASATDGTLFVTWIARRPSYIDALYWRRFSAAGVALGPASIVSPYAQSSPALAQLSKNEFVVLWSDFVGQADVRNEVFRRRVETTGGHLEAPFRVNTYTTSDQRAAGVAVDLQGNFVVVWQSGTQDGSGYGIFGQRYTRAGSAIGAEFQVNTYTTAYQAYPAVAAAPDGSFVVVWTSDAQDGSLSGIFGRRFSAQGLPLAAEFRVNAYTTAAQFGPQVAADASGNFVVAWSSLFQDGSAEGVFAQRFYGHEFARGPEFRVNTTTAGAQVASGLVSDGVGNFTVLWSADGQDGSGFGVFARRFGGLLPAGLAVDTAGNGVFEPGEEVDVVPSWRNVNGAAQVIEGVAVHFSGPLALYEVTWPNASYETIDNGATRACVSCYRARVTADPRPVLHWDGLFRERLTPDAQGQEKLWTVHVGASFTDVGTSNPFYRYIETLLHHGVTTGCGVNTYCPSGSATREQMAAFVLLAKEGPGYQPPPCVFTPMFPDVPNASPFCPFIEELAGRGVVAGCGGGNYCPAAAVSREQMPVFALRTLDPAIDPPACTTPMFGDVPASSPFCRWIEELARRGVVAGCGGGNYCPAAPVTREQMAVFIAGAFGLTLYGP